MARSEVNRERGRSVSLSGDVPDPASPPARCSFHTLCRAVIQPEGYEFDQDTWRRVMDVRVALRDGDIDRHSLERIVASRRNGSKSANVTDTELRAAIREEYGLPEELDGAAEAVVAAAIEALVADDPDAAETHLREAFETSCERRNPDRRETDANREVACHRYDPTVDSDPYWADECATDGQ